MNHRIKNYLLYKDATWLCCLSAAFQSFYLGLLLSELFFLVVLLFCLAFCKLCSSQNGFCRTPFEFDWFILGLFLLALFCLAIIVRVFVLSSISRGSFNSECFLWSFFGGSPHVTGCGSVFLHTIVNRWKKGSRSPRVSPHYCFTGGVKFPQGEGSAVIHHMKNYLLYKGATCLCSAGAAF